MAKTDQPDPCGCQSLTGQASLFITREKPRREYVGLGLRGPLQLGRAVVCLNQGWNCALWSYPVSQGLQIVSADWDRNVEK